MKDEMNIEHSGTVSNEEVTYTNTSERKVTHQKSEEPFKCGYCDEVFSSSSALKRHRRVHSSDRQFRCDCCDKVFSGKS